MSRVERSRSLWQKIRKSPARIPSRVAIDHEHVDEGEKLGPAFQPDEQYFQVRVNELYLAYGRMWFKTYDPMVFVVSEFSYGKEVEAVPFVVGPMMLEKIGQKLPAGMVFSDTRVAGLHPYRGGRLTVTVVLCRVLRMNYLRSLLQIVESAAKVFDFSTAVSTYLKVADVVLDGVEALFESGKTDPLIGLRKEFDPDAGEILQPGYFALIDMDEKQLKADELWVRDRQLLYGKSLADAEPFRHADYVLYSIAQTSERSDVSILPFYSQLDRVVKEASVPTDEGWQSATANMLSLYQTMLLSPDLIRKQACALAEKYKAEIKKIHETAVDNAKLGLRRRKRSELDKIRKQSLDILEM